MQITSATWSAQSIDQPVSSDSDTASPANIHSISIKRIYVLYPHPRWRFLLVLSTYRSRNERLAIKTRRLCHRSKLSIRVSTMLHPLWINQTWALSPASFRRKSYEFMHFVIQIKRTFTKIIVSTWMPARRSHVGQIGSAERLAGHYQRT